jgi:hypothetical protein
VTPAAQSTVLVRLRTWIACRRCAVGWTLYLIAAAAAVAVFATS